MSGVLSFLDFFGLGLMTWKRGVIRLDGGEEVSENKAEEQVYVAGKSGEREKKLQVGWREVSEKTWELG